MKIIVSNFILLIYCFFYQGVHAEIITNVTFKSRTYYVDIMRSSAQNGARVEVWFRVSNSATSLDDFKVCDLSAASQSFGNYTNLVCRGKNVVDAGRTILGCTSVIGSTFCATAAVASEGALAFVCQTTWNYAIEYGAADCLEGAADAIATYLGKQKEWKVIGAAALLRDPKLSDVISATIDFMCEDIKNKKE